MGAGVQDVGGTHVYLWLIHADVWQKASQYCNYPPIKINRSIKKMVAQISGLYSIFNRRQCVCREITVRGSSFRLPRVASGRKVNEWEEIE